MSDVVVSEPAGVFSHHSSTVVASVNQKTIAKNKRPAASAFERSAGRSRMASNSRVVVTDPGAAAAGSGRLGAAGRVRTSRTGAGGSARSSPGEASCDQWPSRHQASKL
jgi:hypothetical protein